MKYKDALNWLLRMNFSVKISKMELLLPNSFSLQPTFIPPSLTSKTKSITSLSWTQVINLGVTLHLGPSIVLNIQSMSKSC